MKKEITFSREFPSAIREGGKTLFVEKVLNGIGVEYQSERYFQQLLALNEEALSNDVLSYAELEHFWKSLEKTDEKKLHTIRRLQRYQVGDVLTPAVWSAAPNLSPFIIFAEDVEVTYCPDLLQDEALHWHLHNKRLSEEELCTIANNDGLSLPELRAWFQSPTQAQLVCWTIQRYE